MKDSLDKACKTKGASTERVERKRNKYLFLSSFNLKIKKHIFHNHTEISWLG